MDIPVNAKVECADGPCGQSVCVIVNPTTDEVTYFVVRESTVPHTERLVSVDQVVETTPYLIRLRYTKDKLAALEPFVAVHYIKAERPHYEEMGSSYFALPYVIREEETMSMPVEYERVPPGELAVHRGAQVEASDGHVGQVDEFLVDPKDGRISHLVLREGHLWGQKDVTIPVSEIDHIEEDVVYLKLDKHDVEALPSIPVRRRWL